MDIVRAICNLRPGAEFITRTVNGTTVIEWMDSRQTRPSDAEIAAKMTEDEIHE